MAKKPTATAKSRRKAAPPSSFGKMTNHNFSAPRNKAGYLVIFLFLAPFFVPTLILLGIALIPAWVALFLDRTKNRYGGVTILGCTLAGTMPSLLALWAGPENTITGAFGVILNVFHLMVILGSAAVGWAIYSFAPPVVAVVMRFSTSRHLAALESKQRALVIDWGEDVMQGDAPPPPDPLPGTAPPPPATAAAPPPSLAMPELEEIDNKPVMTGPSLSGGEPTPLANAAQ